MGLLTKIFGTYSDKELKQINKIIKKINSLEPSIQNLSEVRRMNLDRDIRKVNLLIKCFQRLLL